MPDGRVHARATLILGSGLSAFAAMRYGLMAGFASLLGFLATLFVNPDLDLNTRFPKGRPWKWPMWLYWYPYSRLIPHRGFLSHTPVVGTFLRLVYLSPLLFLTSEIVTISPEGSWFLMLAMFISDAQHYFMDVVSTNFKRFRRKHLTRG